MASSKDEVNAADRGHRRWRVAEIAPEALALMLKVGQAWTIVEGVPEGAELRGYTHDPISGLFRLLFEHESFDLVPDGQIPPSIQITLKQLITLKRKEDHYGTGVDRETPPEKLWTFTEGKYQEVNSQ